MNDKLGNDCAGNLLSRADSTPLAETHIAAQDLARKIVSNLVSQGWLSDRVISGDPQQDVDRIYRKIAYLIQPTCTISMIRLIDELKLNITKSIRDFK